MGGQGDGCTVDLDPACARVKSKHTGCGQDRPATGDRGEGDVIGPGARLYLFLTILDLNELSRSRVTVISIGPTSINTVRLLACRACTVDNGIG